MHMKYLAQSLARCKCLTNATSVSPYASRHANTHTHLHLYISIYVARYFNLFSKQHYEILRAHKKIYYEVCSHRAEAGRGRRVQHNRSHE